jgi:hypothetical protein
LLAHWQVAQTARRQKLAKELTDAGPSAAFKGGLGLSIKKLNLCSVSMSVRIDKIKDLICKNLKQIGFEL